MSVGWLKFFRGMYGATTILNALILVVALSSGEKRAESFDKFARSAFILYLLHEIRPS